MRVRILVVSIESRYDPLNRLRACPDSSGNDRSMFEFMESKELRMAMNKKGYHYGIEFTFSYTT